MIVMTFTIKAIDPAASEKGAGVLVEARFDPTIGDVPPIEGRTFMDIGDAINAYMRSHGSPLFDCFKMMRATG